jgi:hypothetical protein
MVLLWTERPSTNMVALQKIYDWFFDFPLGVGVALGGILLTNLGLKIVDWGDGFRFSALCASDGFRYDC